MYVDAGRLVLSPTDLVAHLECPHVTTLNREVAERRRPRPSLDDPSAGVVRRRGDEHEAAVLAEMSSGRRVVEIPQASDPAAAEELTLAAMRGGADRIFQASFYDGRWRGRADFLIRNDARPSELGDWSYDIADTKLARHVKANALLQMALYAQRLDQLQGVPPETLTVILGNRQSVSVAYADVGAYTRRVLHEYERWLAEPPATYPVKVGHCAFCVWFEVCQQRWRLDDDLVLVPFLRRDQREALRAAGITTVAELATVEDDAPVRSVGAATLRRLSAQARLQVTARTRALPPYEFITPIEGGKGLGLLPEPDAADLFFDLEGDPFFGEHGIEYLWGITDVADEFTSWWAHSPEAERQAFEHVVDYLMEAWRNSPDMHVYHYAPYEPSRLKSLSQRYATRVDEVDALLRGERLVDLYAVVRQGLRIGTESYSIKALERFYAPDARAGAGVTNASDSIVEYERWLATADQSILTAIGAYNRDDCVSTRKLRDWLEQRRDEVAQAGHPVPRPGGTGHDIGQHLAGREPELVAVEKRLLYGVPEEPSARTQAQLARSLLAALLEWHRREDRAEWWEFYRVRALAADELVDDPAPLGGLNSPVWLRTEKRSGVWQYQLPAQECRIRVGDRVDHAGDSGGSSEVVRLDIEAGRVELKRALTKAEPHPVGLLPSGPRPADAQQAALRRVGAWVANHGLDGDGPYRGVRDLLAARPPRLSEGTVLKFPDEPAADALCRVAPALGGVLPVQGPPGAGKTYAAARAILALLAAGKTVGITALSHRVITNLLDAVLAADEESTAAGVRLGSRACSAPAVRAVQRAEPGAASRHPAVVVAGSNEVVESALAGGSANLVAGTGWLFAREGIHVDVLVVDEAGQFSLANTIAAGAAANSVILLGDPRQLPQPSKGIHPDGAGVSALEHVLGEHDTIPDHLGLFLDTTWRMHPALCAPVSELSYEGLLLPRPGLERQVVDGEDELAGAGIRWYPVSHQGCSVRSADEVDVIEGLVERLTGRRWDDAGGRSHLLGPADLLIVAPYNAQVGELATRLEGRARVGTVDKFQGQEAPVVILSLTTSSAADAPRGVDFVANRNRLNVAVSRAKSLAIIVGSPALLTAPVSGLSRLLGVNALCRLVECAGEP